MYIHTSVSASVCILYPHPCVHVSVSISACVSVPIPVTVCVCAYVSGYIFVFASISVRVYVTVSVIVSVWSFVFCLHLYVSIFLSLPQIAHDQFRSHSSRAATKKHIKIKSITFSSSLAKVKSKQLQRRFVFTSHTLRSDDQRRSLDNMLQTVSLSDSRLLFSVSGGTSRARETRISSRLHYYTSL